MAPLPENELADVSKTARRVSRIKRGDKEYPCVLDDFHETTFIFRLVGIEILVSEVVELEVSLEYRDVQTFLKGFGKVLAIEESENESYLTVQVEEALIPQVERLQEVYQERQLAINEFLSTARGR